MEQLVNDVETLCDAFESIPRAVTDRMRLETFTGEVRALCVPATVAAIRLHYFISQFHETCPRKILAFTQLRFLLTSEHSNWNSLSDDDKVSLLYSTRLIFNEVFVWQY